MGSRGSAVGAAKKNGTANGTTRRESAFSKLLAKVDEASEKAGYGKSSYTIEYATGPSTSQTIHTVGNTLAAYILADKSGKGSIKYSTFTEGAMTTVTSAYVGGKFINFKNNQMETKSPVKQIRAILKEMGEDYTISVKKSGQHSTKGYTGALGKHSYASSSYDAELVYKKKS